MLARSTPICKFTPYPPPLGRGWRAGTTGCWRPPVSLAEGLLEKPKRVSSYIYGVRYFPQNSGFWRSLGGELYLGQPFSNNLLETSIEYVILG
jgi:hypothetical protein